MVNRIIQKIADEIRREDPRKAIIVMDIVGGTRMYTPETLADEVEQETDIGRSMANAIIRNTIERKFGRRV